MKIHTLKPGDRVTLNPANMARGLVQYCRERGIIDAVGSVAVVSGNRARVEWAAQQFTGWFDADALMAEVQQPGLWV